MLLYAQPFIQGKDRTHLLEFERRVGDVQVPAWLRRVATPLMWREWKEELVAHPDTEFRDYILNGITNGFRVGFNRAVTCRPATSNMRSALDNAAVVQDYLKREVSLGRIIGPISYEARVAGTQLSPFGVIPKSSQPGKWRLIADLSSPENGSVNTGIEPELCYLHVRLDDNSSRTRFTASEDGYRECISNDPSPPK